LIGEQLATEERVRQATSAARKLQTLHKGEGSYLVLANSDGIDYMQTDATQQSLEYLTQWNIPGLIVTSGADVVWMELLPNHDCPPLTELEIATAMEWTHDHDPAHYTSEYRAATILAFCASRRFDANGPIRMGERLILDSSVPSETDRLCLEMADSLDNDKRTIKIKTDKGKLFLHDDGSVLKFGKGFPSPGQECTGESMAATIPRQDLRAIATLADKLPYRKLAREALALQGRLVEK
jgi:hypothetical protein